MYSKTKVPAGTPVGDYNDGRLRFTWNDDVLMEILLWLPAKSIARFKSVCKHWLSLVSSAEFCHLHTLCRLKLRPSLILEMPDSQFFYFDPIMNGEKQMIPYSFSVPNPRIVSSCNGLMLLHSDYTDKSFHVYNPTNKCSKIISVTDTHSDNEPRIVALALAFDPSESPHYKVVCIRKARTYSNKIRSYQIEVYDSESCSWKLSLGPFTFPRVLFPLHASVYWNGSIYWEILYEIGYYDIAKNEFKTLSLPKYPPLQFQGITSNNTYCLQEANGHLYHSRLATKGNCQSITLFELEMDDRCSWLLKYHGIVSRHEPTSISSFDSCARQLRFIKGSYSTETCSVVSHMSGKISVYSFLDKSYKLLIDLTGQLFYHEDAEDFYLEMYEYRECLALV